MRRLAVFVTSIALFAGGVALAPAASAGSASTPDRGQPTLAMADRTTCAIRESGRVYCWGSNGQGNLGRGTNSFDVGWPGQVSALPDAIGIYGNIAAASGGTLCALKVDRTVACWGRGASYLTGNGTTNHQFSPFVVPGLTKVATLALGVANGCAVKQDGTVHCWGGATNIVGNVDRPTPYKIPGLSNVIGVALGHSHACALKLDKTVWCWGSNGNGQLGNSAAGLVSVTPVKVAGLPAATSIASGTTHMCAITTSKTAWCWGSNAYGELGRGTTVASAKAAQVKNLTGVTALSLGDLVSCAIAKAEARCWGRGEGGLLGDAQFSPQFKPVYVEAQKASGTQIAVGSATACEVASKGQVWCWGTNSSGETGNGLATPAYAGAGPGTYFGRAQVPYSVRILNTAPGKPKGSSKAAKKITISWTAPSTSNGTSKPKDYIIQYRVKGTSTWKTFKDSVSTKTSVTVTGLTKGKYYQFRVQGKNWAGKGSWSSASAYIKSK